MIKSAYFYLKHEQIPQKCILEQVLSEGSTAQNGQKVLKNRENPLFHCRRPSPISRASQDLKIPFKTLKLAYFYLKHVQIPHKSIIKQVLSEGSTAQSGQKVLPNRPSKIDQKSVLDAR